MTMAQKTTVCSKVLEDALVPLLDRLKEGSECDSENLCRPVLLTQDICVVGFRGPEKLDDITALHQGKNANNLVSFGYDGGANREIMTE
jgi:hypothetical protein